MADPRSAPGTGRDEDASPPDGDADVGTPRWVIVFGIVAAIFVVLFAAVHLAGGGFRNHMSHLRP